MPKTALITGATSGFGYEFVRLFVQDGYELVLVARNEQRLKQIQAQFPQTSITIIPKDLTQSNAVEEVYEELKARNIHIDILINNAGFGLLGYFNQLDLKRQTDMIQLNVTVLIELTHRLLPAMKEKKYGKILNVASTAAFQPGPKMTVYFATKAFVLSFSEALAEELQGTGISITTLCPGPSKTNFAKAANVEGTKMFSKVMDARIVTVEGYRGMMQGKRVIIPGGVNKLGAYAAKFLPRSLVAKVAKWLTPDQ
ncbi:MAG TPA: SDR family oxidoreductase [Bacillota bacterium]|nr:SDR family oxidoreductase [Bacillota bacterium]